MTDLDVNGDFVTRLLYLEAEGFVGTPAAARPVRARSKKADNEIGDFMVAGSGGGDEPLLDGGGAIDFGVVLLVGRQTDL